MMVTAALFVIANENRAVAMYVQVINPNCHHKRFDFQHKEQFTAEFGNLKRHKRVVVFLILEYAHTH